MPGGRLAATVGGWPLLSDRPAGDAPRPRGEVPVAHDIDFSKALAELSRARSVVLTTHVKPDADALGSAAALSRWLRALGKTVQTILPSPPAPKYAFLDPDLAVKVAGRDVNVSTLEPPDLVCIVDACTWGQLEGMGPLIADSGATVLVIDHHPTRDPLADVEVCDPDAAAAAVLVHGLLRKAGAAIDPLTAMYLLAGLVGDTDWFRVPSVTGAVLELAASLVRAGASPAEVYRHLEQGDDLAKVHLWGRAIETLHPALDGRTMVMSLTRSLFREMGADVGDTEGLIKECMRVRGTQVGVLLIEANGDEVRVSLRSQDPVNVLAVAERFGGGGHRRAAGARLTGPMDDVERRVLEAVAETLWKAEAAEAAEKA